MYTYENLPESDNLNRFSYSILVKEQMFIQKGKMIAYYGNLRFESVGKNLLEFYVQQAFDSPFALDHFVIVKGAGKLILADDGKDVASYDLEDAHLTIKRAYVLGFAETLTCQESTFPGYLTFHGTGQLIASSNGPVHFLPSPVRVDEQALLGWADLPTPAYHYDYEYIRNLITLMGSLAGVTFSGEEKQLDFRGKGTVLIQSSELVN